MDDGNKPPEQKTLPFAPYTMPYDNAVDLLRAFDELTATLAAMPLPTDPKEREAELRFWVHIAQTAPECENKLRAIRLRAERNASKMLRQALRDDPDLLSKLR